MNSKTFSTQALGLALALAMGAGGAAMAQVPSGGPDAKGNAPLKHGHTVNDGTAKPGRTSFTMSQAQRHIEHAGYTAVSGLTKGDDGVWRGRATKDGTTRDVGLDFKGNISEGAMSGGSSTSSTTRTMTPAPMPMRSASTTTTSATSATTTSARTGAMRHHHHRRHRHHVTANCANPAPNGAACSGIDRNRNGVSDKEDRAIQAGAKP